MQDRFKVIQTAEKYVVSRQFDRAISEYRQLLKIYGEDPSVLNTLGDLLLKSGKEEEAKT